MIGNVRSLDITAALAALRRGPARRLRGVVHRVWAAAQVRLNLGGIAPVGNLTGSPVIPTVRYRDVPAAVDWLCRAFGMRVHRVVADAAGAPCYAELTVGSGMLIVAPIEETTFGKLMVQPDEIGGVETQVCYLCVGNVRGHHARAKAAGAVIVIDPEDEANQGRGYSCRDPEGHVWNFGTYDPWQRRPPARPAGRLSLASVLRLDPAQKAAAATVALALGAALIVELLPQPSARAGTAATAATQVAPQAAPPPGGEQPRQEPAPPAAQDGPARNAATDGTSAADTLARDKASAGAPARHKAHQYRVALETVERSAAATRARLARMKTALAEAEREAGTARARLQEMQRAKAAAEQARLAAERAADAARTQLAAAQGKAERARAQSVRERARRRAATRAAARARRGTPARARRQRPRRWCYDPYAPPNGRGRLSGFCSG